MTESKQLEIELGYIRQLVRKPERGQSPIPIYLLWAAIVLVGFSIVDFARHHVGLGWIVAGPLGGVMSGFLGWRHGLARGQMRRDIGLRHGLHWFGMMTVILLAVPLGVTGAVVWQELDKVILLIIALGYFLAGVHIARTSHQLSAAAADMALPASVGLIQE